MAKTTPCACKINKMLIPLKAFYFLFFSGIGDLLPFIPIYMKRLGLTSQEAGIIYGTMPFIGFLMKPLFGFLADRYHKHKLILLLCCLLTGVFYLLLLLVPPKQISLSTIVKTNVHCNTQDSYIRDCVPELINTRHQSCPLTFSEYANITLQQNLSGAQCIASCQFAIPGAYNSRICFTTYVQPYAERKCFDIWVSSRKESRIIFTLLNASTTAESELLQDRQLLPELLCHDYNLKNLSHKKKTYWQMLCDEDTILNCQLTCTKQDASRCSQNTEVYGISFYLFFIIFLLGNIFFSPILSLTDAITYNLLGDKRHNWGHQRMWGTLGFALFAILSTVVMDYLQQLEHQIDYSISFYLFSSLMLLSCIAGYKLEISTLLTCAHIFQNITSLIHSFEILAFFFVILIFGIYNGVIEGFLFWYLLDLHASQTILGLCLLMNCLPEIFFLFLSGKVIKKIGHVACLYLAFAAFSVRLIGYSFIWNPWYSLPIELLNGFSFALMYAAASAYASMMAPPGMSATIQGVLGGIYFGFGKAIGSIVTGVLFGILGERWTFRAYGISSFMFLILYMSLQCLLFRRRSIRVETPEQTSKFDTLEEDTVPGSPIDRLLTEDTISQGEADDHILPGTSNDL